MAQQKLRTLDNTLRLVSRKDTRLDRKIREIANLESDDEMFRLFTELLVVSRVLSSQPINFQYEEPIHGSRSKFDINLDFLGQRVRIDVTHKEDVYQLSDTAELITTNLRYANPNCGGDIQYAPPVKQNYPNGTVIYSKDMTESEVQETIENAFKLLPLLSSQSVTVPCPSPFFQITLNPKSTVWTGGTGGTWYSPNIDGYLRSIQKKAAKSIKVRDGSYTIIALDFVPGSDFHNESYYREQLVQQLLQIDLRTSSSIDEVVTFSMRFENGKFENLALLWARTLTSLPIFMQLLS
ncbi:MAG: hypothetical protein HYR77_12355 [Ignavibacteria bacterium]|nr:hypothetical protein [Ignavibacteria bacterium]